MLIRVLGPVEVEHDGQLLNIGGPQQRRLLAFLVIHRGHSVSTDRIIEALWDEGEVPDGAARSMRTYMSRLRAAVPGLVIRRSSAGYALDLPSADREIELDVDHFEALLSGATNTAPDLALVAYEQAASMWRGPPFGEFGAQWWAVPDAARLLERRHVLDEERCATLLALGMHGTAVAELERITAALPLRERPVRLMMQALALSGRHAEALRVARTFCERLAEETGLDPSSQLTDLESSILAGGEGAAIDRPLRGYTLHGPIRTRPRGRVYAATQPGTDREVAIEVIAGDMADDPDFVRHFDADARRIARLEHPHVVPLYDFWREPGCAYLVTRRLSGTTLRDSIVDDGSWPIDRVRRLAEELGGLLIAARTARVAPLSLDVDSVLLDADGAAYFGEFEVGGGDAHLEDRCSCVVAEFACLLEAALAGDVLEVRSRTDRRAQRPGEVDQVLSRARSGEFGQLTEFLAAWNDAVDPMPGSRRRNAERGPNPYLGLRAFDDSDGDVFFGRDDVVGELCRHLDSARFVAVIGPSGSGKSSVVRAGLATRVRSSGGVVTMMTPGDCALSSLAEAMSAVAIARVAAHDAAAGSSITAQEVIAVARSLGRLVIVVDQLEECWTRCPPADRADFLAVVDEIIGSGEADVRVVATVRADLLDRPLADPTIGPLLGTGSFVLAPMSPAQLRLAIERPAAGAGVDVADEVVADLLAVSNRQPGHLPLLQFTLTELFDRCQGASIDRTTLESIGGVAGAIGRRAEAIFHALSEEDRIAARELFGRLVVPGDAAPDARRRARSSELSPSMLAVASRFVEGRLLVSDRDPATREPVVEVAHEALFSGWPRLRRWIDEDRHWLLQLQHLTATAGQWDERGRPDSELYRGARLEAVVETIESEQRSISALAAAFVDESRCQRQRELDAERRRVRRLRTVVAATSVLAAVAVALGSVAVFQRNDARRAEQAEAVASRDASIEVLVGRSESLRPSQRDVAALLAIEAFRLADTPRTRSALFATFTDDEWFLDAHRFDGDVGRSGLVMPDGRAAFMADQFGRVRSYDLDTGELGGALPEEVAAGRDTFPVLAASLDGRSLLVAARSDPRDGPTEVGVVDLAGGTLRFEPIEIAGAVTAATFVPDERVALATGEDGRLVVISASTGSIVAEVAGVEVPPDEFVWTPEPGDSTSSPALRRPSSLALDEDRLLVGAADGSIRAIDITTYEVIAALRSVPESTSDLRPLGDGTVIATGRRAVARLRIADGSTLWVEQELDGCVSLTVIAEQHALFCGDPYGRLRERDIRTGAVRRQLDAQNGNPGSLWPADGGAELVSFGRSQPIVSRWRLDGSGPITSVTPPGWVPVDFDPDGELLLVETGDVWSGTYEAGLVDPRDPTTVQPVPGLIVPSWSGPSELFGGAFADDGRIEYARLGVIDGRPGEAAVTGVAVDDVEVVSDARIDVGKRRTLLRYRDGARNWLTTVDPQTLDVGATIETPNLVAWTVTRDGSRVAAGTGSGIVVYDAATGAEIHKLADADLRSVAITAADQLVVGSVGGGLTMYDLGSFEPIGTLSGTRGLMFGASSSGDGTMIAVTTGDRTASLYDAATGIRIGGPITTAIGELGSNAPHLSLDGRWLSLRSRLHTGDSMTQIWDLDPERWIDAACALAGRNLTPGEWSTHIGGLHPYRATCPG